MEGIKKDEIFSLAINLDLWDLLNLCQTSKRINSLLCEKDEIWNYKLETEFKREKDQFLDLKFEPKHLYKIIYQLYGVQDSMTNYHQLPTLRQLYDTAVFRLNNDKNIKQLPRSIEILKNLKYLYINDNSLKTLPKEIGNLIGLVEIDASRNLIEYVPKEIGNLLNLEKLFLQSNQLINIPEELNNLTNLKILHLSDNNISGLPHLENLKKLEILTLGDMPFSKKHNSIKTLDEIPNLKKLKYLTLPDNKFESELKKLGFNYNMSSGAFTK